MTDPPNNRITQITELNSRGDTVHNYSFRVDWSEEDGAYVATSAEFPEASALASTPEEAIAELKIALEGVIAVMEEDGEPIPAPETLSEYSGQFRLRLAKSMHAALARRADREGVSLNTLALTYLACGLASDYTTTKAAKQLAELMVATQPAKLSSYFENPQITGAPGVFGAAPVFSFTKTGATS